MGFESVLAVVFAVVLARMLLGVVGFLIIACLILVWLGWRPFKGWVRAWTVPAAGVYKRGWTPHSTAGVAA